MAIHQLHAVIRHLRRLTGQQSGGSSDAQLLERWITRRDDAAFEVLVWRHGPMVLSLSRHLLANAQDAEDAFQATFLTLLRKAPSIGKRESVGSWLYKVAFRVALAAKRRASDRAPPVRPEANLNEPAACVEQRDLHRVVREEVNRLPEKYRAPVVLCHLEGKTHEVAAEELGWAKGTVSARLMRARDLLRSRLARRGLALSALGVTVELSPDATAASRPASLAAAAARAAGRYATNQGTAGLVSSEAVALAEGVMRAMFLRKLRMAAIALLAVGVTALGTGLVAHQAQTEPPKEAAAPQPGAEQEKKEGVDLHGDPLPPGVVARLGTVRFRADDEGQGIACQGIAFTPDSKGILMGSWAGAIHLCDAATGKRLRRIALEGEPYGRILFSPDGKLIATTEDLGEDPTGYGIGFRDASTGKKHRVIRLAKADAPGPMAFAPDSTLLASCHDDLTLRLWDVPSGTEVLRGKLPDRPGRSLVFSPDGKTIVGTSAGSPKTEFYIWEHDAGVEPRTVKAPGAIETLAFSPDGKTLALMDYVRVNVYLWDVASGRCLRTLRLPKGWARDVAFSPDGKMLALACEQPGSVVFWDPSTGQELHRLNAPLEHWKRVVFSPDSKRVAARSQDAVRVWEVNGWKELGALDAAHREAITATIFSSRESLVATAGDDGSARLWEATTGRQRAVFRHDNWVRAVAVSPDGRQIATSSLDDTVRVWDTATGKQLFNLAGHGKSGGHRVLQFSPDGKRLASWGDTYWYLRVWDTTTGKALLEHKLRATGVQHADDDDDSVDNQKLEMLAMWGLQATFSHDAKTLILAVQTTLHVFDVESGKETLRINASDDAGCSSLAVSHDGKRLAAAAEARPHQVKNPDGTVRYVRSGCSVRLWDLASGKQLLRNGLPDTTRIAQIEFTPDDKCFVAVTQRPSAVVHFWDTESGDEVRVIEGLPSRPHCLAFSPDGKLMTVGLQDTTALVYDLTRET
ncbi:MAG TPA: sigma-70 family RNA polymerase sigma factor, partial [Gemmataceae bacterium]|nr:sigma-70 family RNA polymerase sigma factor [Gemmataceae bacterium]